MRRAGHVRTRRERAARGGRRMLWDANRRCQVPREGQAVSKGPPRRFVSGAAWTWGVLARGFVRYFCVGFFFSFNDDRELFGK
jgi:hypothetical protein